MDKNLVLEKAIGDYLGKLNEEAAKRIHNPQLEYEQYYEDFRSERRVSRKGNIVITVVQEGEFVSGGPIEDPFTTPYGYAYRVVFAPDGKFIQEIHSTS